MALAHGISAETVRQGQAILDDKSVSIGEVKDNFLEFLDQMKLLQKGILHTDLLLTHPKTVDRCF